MSFSGVVLTGGSSSRMGQDKALLEVGGRPLASVARDALVDAGAAEVLAVGGDQPALRALGFATVRDTWPGEGPLGAVVTALGAAAYDVVVVLACDLPFVCAAAVTAVVEAVRNHDAAAPAESGHLHVLAAAYHRRCLSALQHAFAGGERSLSRALSAMRVAHIELRDPRWVLNANSPAELAGFSWPDASG